MDNRFHRTSFGHISNFMINIAKRRFTKDRFFRSLLTSLYVTLRCNLRCNYCNYHKLNQKELDTKSMLRLLEKIRPKNPSLNITGGEPLVRDDIIEILKKARELKFAPIVLNTNALLLHKKEECLRYVDYVIVSLDSLNEDKWDKILGVNGASKIIINNIRKYSKLQKKYGFRMTINSVITPSSIKDIYDVIEFCNKLRLPMGPVPQDNGMVPEQNLTNNPGYKKLLNDIIEMKKKGYSIAISDIFLRQIRDFPGHNCFPTLVPRIFPDGSVFYPCNPLHKIYGNLLDYPDLDTMLREAYKKEGLPACSINSKKCFMSCYMEFVNVVEHPFSALNFAKY